MDGITESFVLSGTKGISVKVTITESYNNLANTSDLSVAVEVASSAYYGHVYYLDGAVAAAGQTLQTMSSFYGTHNVYVQQTDTFYPIEKGDDDHTGSPWNLQGLLHETDGSKIITVSVQLSGEEANGNGADGWTVTGSREITLTHIPRASTVAATDAAVGSVSMVAVNRKSAAYTHSVAYQFGNLKGFITPDGITEDEVLFSETSIAFTIPQNFYTQIPNAKSGSCLLTCRTYYGENCVGEEKSSTFTVTTDEAACKPLLSGTVTDGNSATVALTGDNNTLVRYASTANCAITAQVRNDATLAKKTIADQVVTGNSLTIPAVESNTVVFTATDSRGYTETVSVEKNWVSYILLTCNVEGKRTDPTSGNAKVVISGDFFAGSFGSAQNTLQIMYRIFPGEWNTAIATVEDNRYCAQLQLSGLLYTQDHTIDVRVSDQLQTVTKSLTIGKGIPVFDWGEKDFSFHVPVYFRAGLYNGDGTQIKP